MAKRYVNGVLEDIPASEVIPFSAPSVPVSVSRFQAFAALDEIGQLASVELLVNSAGSLAKIAWNNATEFRRDSPTIAKIAMAKKWNKTFVDDMFIRASQITA